MASAADTSQHWSKKQTDFSNFSTLDFISTLSSFTETWRLEQDSLSYWTKWNLHLHVNFQELDVGLANGIRAMNITHTGELGYVLYIPNEVCTELFL